MYATALSFDVGGTETRGKRWYLQPDGHVADLGTATVFNSKEFTTFGDAVAKYLQLSPGPYDALTIGLPGPVDDRGNCTTTHLPWQVNRTDLEQRFGTSFRHIVTMNDFGAASHGVPSLVPSQLLTINPGRDGARGNLTLLGPGTGLGVAGLYFDGWEHHPYSTEGGHPDFAPFGDWSLDLLEFMRRKRQAEEISDWYRVSWEMLCSGPGLCNIYQWVHAKRMAAVQTWYCTTPPDKRPEAIASQAAAGDATCCQTMQVFFEVIASLAGNLCLAQGGFGGFFIAVVIPRKNRIFIENEAALARFRHTFSGKGEDPGHRKLLAGVPVYLVLDDELALRGAAAAVRSIVYPKG